MVNQLANTLGPDASAMMVISSGNFIEGLQSKDGRSSRVGLIHTKDMDDYVHTQSIDGPNSSEASCYRGILRRWQHEDSN